jgi:ribosome biogenesis GTPase
MTLSTLGWDDAFAAAFQPHLSDGLLPARVALEHKHAYEVLTVAGELSAECGDWVAIRPRPNELHADIHAVLPRRTKFSRTAVGNAGEQIVATNVDHVLLVTALDQNYNLRRIERYLTVAWESGAQPIIVLNKSDLHPDAETARAEVESIAIGAPVVALSAARGDGLDALEPWLVPGRTLAFLGSSGVGKSTLINRLLGTERLATRAISSAVGKGRHTTSHRELIVAPSGVIVIDTPGMRELQLWEMDTRAVETTFSDVTAIIARCRFTDCAHRGEPGCAVAAALDDGSLELDRWQSFQKLQREQAYAARRNDPRLARELKEDWKKIHRAMRQQERFRNGK